MNKQVCILALDIGSSSARARLYDGDLRPLRISTEATWAYRWSTEADTMQTDPELLLGGVAAVIDAGVAAAEAGGVRIEAVAVTTFWHSLLGLNASGEPLTPLYGWGDSRAASAAAALRSRIDADHYHDRTGCFLRAEYPAAKLAWLREWDEEGFAAVRTWASFGDYLEGSFFGTRRTSFSIASATGLLDVRRLRWDDEILQQLGLSADVLPSLADQVPVQGLRGAWRTRWPQLATVPWFPAIGDGACANVGSGAIGPARPGLTVGTSAAVRIVRRASAEEKVPPRLWDYRLDREYRVAGGALSNGGNGLAFLVETFPGMSIEALSAALTEDAADVEGLTILPGLTAERGGRRDENIGAAILGLRLGTEPLQIAKAWMESLARRIAEPYRALELEFGVAEEVRVTGGAVRALPGWLQTLADVLERPVRLAEDEEATSRGAAIVAARDLGWIDSIEVAPSPTSDGADPIRSNHLAHLRARERESAIAEALRRGVDHATRPQSPDPH